MSCPWGKIQSVGEPVSLLEITSEQLAQSLQEKELKKYEIETVNNSNIQDHAMYESDDTKNDEMIAHMLQEDFSKDHNLMLKRTEEKFNRNSKVNITYTNYRSSVYDDQDDDDIDVEDTDRDFDRFVSIERECASMPRCGYRKLGGKGSPIVTKHDILRSSRINACRILYLPPGMDTGDTGGFDVKLNNKVYNSLSVYGHAQHSRQKAKLRLNSKK